MSEPPERKGSGLPGWVVAVLTVLGVLGIGGVLFVGVVAYACSK